jgi:hypothetical protein
MIRSRRAVSLVELLVVMSACTGVLTLSSVLLVRTMRIQMQSRAHGDAERNSLRLSDHFRRNVHQAKSAVSSRGELEGDVFLRLQLADGQQVEYSRIGNTVLRLSTENNDRVSRQEFAFPADCKLSVHELESPPRLALTITTEQGFSAPFDGNKASRTFAIPVSLHVEANLGRNLRYAKTTEAEDVVP